jgi:2-aminobenzoate-CoA ligase
VASVNLAATLLYEHLNRGCGHRPAVATVDGSLSYGDLAASVDSCARALRAAGVDCGDRVLLRLSNDASFIAAWLAVQKVGAVAVPTSPALRARELGVIAADARPKACFVSAGERDEAGRALSNLGLRSIAVAVDRGGTPGVVGASAVAAAPDQDDLAPPRTDAPANLSYVADASPAARGICHTAAEMLAACDAYARPVLGATPDDVFGGATPMWFSYGLGCLLVAPLRLGATTAPIAAFTVEAVVDAVTRRRISLLFGTATAYRLLIHVPHLQSRLGRHALRRCVSAGEHLDGSIGTAWKRLTGLDVINGLGTTQTFHIFLSTRPGTTPPGSVGEPVPGYDVGLLDDSGAILSGPASGLLAVRGPSIGRVWNSRDGSPVSGAGAWCVTGDRMWRDGAGRYCYLGRADRMIVSAGYNISPAEIETVLSSHPSVRAVTVAGVADPVRGAVPAAYVSWTSGMPEGEPSIAALREHAQRELAGYKCPRHYVEVDRPAVKP